MRRGGWFHFWRSESNALALLRATTHAIVAGEAIETLIERSARGLLEAGKAQRAGIWLESSDQPQVFEGAVVEAGADRVPEEWRRLELTMPLLGILLESPEPVVADLRELPWAWMIGPLAEMRTAVWIPLRFRERALGVALVAYGVSSLPSDIAFLRALAEAFVVAAVHRRDSLGLERKEEELAAQVELQRALLEGGAARQILGRVAAQAARYTRAKFVAIAESAGEQLRFTVFEGPPDLAPLAQDERLSATWRTALEERRIVVTDLRATAGARPAGELLRSPQVSIVAALPLAVRGKLLGLLLAGFSSGTEVTAVPPRLEPYAILAAAALWEEQRSILAAQREVSSRALLESAAESVLVIDHEGVIQEASRLARERCGLQLSSLGQRRLEDLFSSAAREAVEAWRQAASPGRASDPLEATLLTGLTVRVSLQNGLLPQGHLQLRLDDVTALRQSEQRWKRAEAELLSVLDAVDSGVLLLDATGGIRVANARFAQMMGLDAQWMAEITEFDSLVEAIQGRFRESQAFARRWRELYYTGDEAAWDELELVQPQRKMVQRFARPVLESARNRIGWLEVYRDITGQRLIESKLLQTEKMAALGQLVSGIAHELNNPLTSIMGYAQLLLSRRLGSDRIADAQKIFQEAERAGCIVKNLLLFARETKPERKLVQLNEIVERTLALRSYELKVENIAVDLHLDPELPRTLADSHQLQQVVLNLLVNAEQAILQAGSQGRIRIRTYTISGKRLALEMADDGPSIPPEIASRIFDPFFTTKPVGVGTGLGLSIVYGIVQQHGGEIYLDNQPGWGATFVVELPIVVALAEEQALEGRQPAPVTPTGPGRRILVVEDEPTVAQLIAEVLREGGHQVEVVLDSQEGLNRLARQNYDLVICDLKMPRLDGQAFYRSVVQSGSSRQPRIIFVTGDTLTPHTLEFLEKKGLPYLAKPFLIEELKQAVNQLLESNSSEGRASDAGELAKDNQRR